MTTLPPDKQLIEEIRKTIKVAPHLMQCTFCSNYCNATGECSITHRTFAPYVRGCNGNFFVTNEELLLKRVKDDLMGTAKKCDEIEALFALGSALQGASECAFADAGRMKRELRSETKDKREKQLLYKDNEMIQDITYGFHQINDIMKELWEIHDRKTKEWLDAIDEKLEEIDKQHGWHIQNNINKLFSENGKFSTTNSDRMLNNSMDIFREVGYYVKGCIGNEANHKKVFAELSSLENDVPYSLGHKYFDKFQLK
jgi:hypothetical protein